MDLLTPGEGMPRLETADDSITRSGEYSLMIVLVGSLLRVDIPYLKSCQLSCDETIVIDDRIPILIYGTSQEC